MPGSKSCDRTDNRKEETVTQLTEKKTSYSFFSPSSISISNLLLVPTQFFLTSTPPVFIYVSQKNIGWVISD